MSDQARDRLPASVCLVSYPTLGGSSRVATELAARLVGGCEVHLVSYERPVGLHDAVRFHRVDVLDYPLYRYPPYDQALATMLAAIAERYGVRLVHAHYAVPHALAVGLANQLLGGEPGRGPLRLVTTLHGTDITLVGGTPAYRRAVRYALERSNVVTAVSQSLAEDTRRIVGFSGAIRVVPNFVDAGVFRPGSSPRWPDRPAGVPRRLVHISTFRPVKRVLDLCRAVAVLARDVPVQLTLVGDGPELLPALELLGRVGLADAVQAVGACDEPARFLAEADLYVFASRTESFGLGLLEAMAAGVPVVGPRVGGVGEVVGDPPAGRLVAAGRPLALAEAARDLLTDAVLYRQAQELARARAEGVFRPERVVPLYLEAYREAARCP